MSEEEILALIRARGWPLVTLKRLTAAGVDPLAAEAPLEALAAKGVLQRCGTIGLAYQVLDLDAPAASASKAPEPAPAPAAPAPAPAAAELAQAEPEAPAQKPAPEAPAPRLKKPDFRKPSKLDRLLAQIEASEAPKVFEGEERDAKASETLERMMDIIVRVNGGITSLSERAGYGIVDPDTDLITILREENGIKASYSPDGGRTDKVLYFEAWPKAMTEKWCETAVARLEKQAVDLLDRMTQYCVKASRPKKAKR